MTGLVLVTVKARRTQFQLTDLDELLDVVPEKEPKRPRGSTAHLAGSRFNELVTCSQIALDNGLELVRTDPNGDEHYHHPQASNETSLTVYAEDGHATCWSETMGERYRMPLRRPMDPFGLWTFFNFTGDFSAARAFLVLHGIPDRLDSAGSNESSTHSSGPRTLIVEQSSKITQRKLRWIWKGWLPLRKITMLDGDPDVGKSTLMIDIAARITTGALMPDGSPGIKGDVIFLSEEDDADDTITWRLDAAGADRSRVFHVHGTKDADGECPITIPDDLELLEEEIKRHETVLVIIDVLDEYLAEKVDSHKNQSMRRVLRLLRGVASRNDVAIICLRHFKKEATDKAIYRGGGSIGIIGAARAGWALGYHPDDQSVRVLARQKGNLSVQADKALTFKLQAWEQDSDYARVDWRGEIDLKADQLLQPPTPQPTEEQEDARTKIEQCKRLLMALMRESGEHWTKDILHELREAGFKDRTIDSARARCPIEPKPGKLPDGTRAYYLILTEEAET